jgi:hypothetical protein
VIRGVQLQLQEHNHCASMAERFDSGFPALVALVKGIQMHVGFLLARIYAFCSKMG